MNVETIVNILNLDTQKKGLNCYYKICFSTIVFDTSLVSFQSYEFSRAENIW